METQFTVSEAAKIMDMSTERLYQLQREGVIEIVKGRKNRQQLQRLVSYDVLLRLIDSQDRKTQRQRARLHTAASGRMDLL